MSDTSGTVDLLTQARVWADTDPDPVTRAELEDLIERAGDPTVLADLTDRFTGTLQFGTAGLRGALGAGPNRMNRVVVARAAAGLASYLVARGGGSVVIGYDARHNSEAFAHDTAEIVQGAGLEALVLPRPLPTPVLAYAIGALGAAAGVMVTASHNPPQDNGYKVYLADGSQIVPPADLEIAAEIAAVGEVSQIPRSQAWVTVGDEVLSSYIAGATSLVDACGPRGLKIVYTPLHGVGGEVAEKVLKLAGFSDVTSVPQQFAPDPDFPTVAFPNPEEPGAMDLAFALATETGADLVLANDPDADRAAVGVPTTAGWTMLRGDEVGVLLADFLLSRGAQGTFACSIVSSSLLGKVAAAHGQPYVETLTGFKWIGRLPGLAFGYEEALGYCVDPSRVKDKDGISAILRIAELAALLKASGQTLTDRLDEIALEYGVHATDQLSVRVTVLSEITAAMARLRDQPPTHLGGLAVTSVEDLSIGAGGLPPTDGLRYRLEQGARVIVRPSGTEPKIKCYLEVVEPVTDTVAGARAAAAHALAAIRQDLATAAGL